MHWDRTAQRSKGRQTANGSAKKLTGGQTLDGRSILSQPLFPLWEGLRAVYNEVGVMGLINFSGRHSGGWAQGQGERNALRRWETVQS